jgi:hypothetical protein
MQVKDGLDLISGLTDGWRLLERSLAFWAPAVDLPSWVAPAAALVSLLSLVVLAGISIGSLATLLTALLIAQLLLEQVFGVAFELSS